MASGPAMGSPETTPDAVHGSNVSLLLLSGHTVEIADVPAGSRVVKHPGDIRGDSLLIKNCIDARIYILDHSSDVEVIGCRNVEIYIMCVVDGPALFADCVGCKVVVASQQFQAKRCEDCWFGIYSVTGPTLSESRGIKISPWSGAGSEPTVSSGAPDAPDVTMSLDAAVLDPSGNQWLNVYDASEPVSAEESRRNFELGFDPIQVRILEVRNRGDSSTEENLMVFSSPQETDKVINHPIMDVATGDGIPHVPDNDDPDGSIKAIKIQNPVTLDTAEQWQKTIDLIDMNNNNNRHLARFKSVLLSMAEIDCDSRPE